MDRIASKLVCLATGAATVLLSVAGCTGEIGQTGKTGKTIGQNPPPAAAAGGLTCDAKANLAPARIWQLTDEEYVNVVRDVFKVQLTGDDAAVTTAGSVTGNYSNLSESGTVVSTTVQSYQRAATKLAPLILAKLPTLVSGCSAAPDAACMDKFIHSVVPLAWRRPVSDAEAQGLIGLYNMAATDGPVRGATLVLQAVLQSGSFLYRTEMGTNAATATGAVAMTPHEVASALSFMFLESVPDAPLWAKAQDGTLTKPAVLAAEVDRLMALPQAQATLTKRVSYWAGLERIPLVQKDTKVFPEWTPALRDALYQSSQKFLQDVVVGGTLSDLMSSTKVYANQTIAKVYGYSGATTSDLVPVVADGPLAGIFTQPALLAATDHRQALGDPIHRGLYIYEQYVCSDAIPAPPANALAVAATMMGTERQLAQMRAQLSCKVCHARFDPIGLTTEPFDPIGRYKPTDAMGNAVDATADVTGIGDDLDGHYDGIAELAAKLRMGNRAANCAGKSLGQYALGYTPELLNSCAIRDVKASFAKTGSFSGFFRALATSPGFLSRDAVVK